MATDPPPISDAAKRKLVEQLHGVAEPIVLIGGQAVSVWALRYQDRIPLPEGELLVSKDVDLVGGPNAVHACATALDGVPIVAKPFRHTPNAGVVQFVDADGYDRALDVLKAPLGFKNHTEIVRMSIPALIGDASIRVMHPVHCLESRAINVARLPGYDGPKGQAQLAASILCAREFLRELLDHGETRHVLRLNKRIFHFSQKQVARLVFDKYGQDTFLGTLLDDRLPPEFERECYPRWKRQIDDGRERRRRNRAARTTSQT